MAEEFARSVEEGLRLSKRLYFGKDRAVAPPKPIPAMDRTIPPSSSAFLPAAPMVYAVVSDPGIVDNPDIPSYQPHVYGRCDPPALIPLTMNRVELEADSYFDSVLVRLSGSWRVHCVMGSKSCDCRVAIPMGLQGTILGVEVEVSGRLFSTEIVAIDEKKEGEKEVRTGDGGYLLPHIFTVTIPKVDGGSTLSIKASWMQKLSYRDEEFTLTIPFSFPEYVTPSVKKLAKKEKILLNVDSGAGTEIVCRNTSHPLKQSKREAGKLSFVYESEVLTWTNTDFFVSYNVSSSHIHGNVLLQSPSVHDIDQREMFCLYLCPGEEQKKKVFRKEIVFVVDISGSMEGKPIDGTISALSASLNKLDSKDSFNIIAFNGETNLFSTSMELATEESIDRAVEWINTNFIAGGSTDILRPLEQAIEMLSSSRGSTPIVFLVTDGSVENERNICDVMKGRLTSGGSIFPRMYTFGIGSYCNHHFLRKLAVINRGYYDAAYHVDSIESHMQKLLENASSIILANITIETESVDDFELEVYPSRIPDLSYGGPVTVSGRYKGNFPDTLKVKGVLGDSSNFVTEIKAQKAKDIPLEKIFARQQIDLLTSEAWFSEDKQLEEKIAKLSIQTGVASEYTRMTLLETHTEIQATESHKSDPQKVDNKNQRRILLPSLCIGFGDITATSENIPPGYEKPKLPEAAEIIIKAASNCCGRIWGCCCCPCCIDCCTKLNDRVFIVLTQFCAALACIGCFECCSLCCSGNDGN